MLEGELRRGRTSTSAFPAAGRGEKKGIVFLVGAGPGDPGLITAKGINCIKKSDVLVYDRLVNEYLLNYAPENAQLLFAGKSSEKHYLTQEGINELLLEKVLQGFTVTRLKGGDPFLFGRGGEEAEYLAHHNAPFEVVPGITSALAVPAYAGIPLTHRLYSSSISVFSGRLACDKDNELPSLDKEMTGAETLIFLMGAGTLSSIVNKLLENGRSPSTPTALVCWGTWPEQKTIIGHLENIVSKAAEASFKPPAVIVVGEVVNLREKLSWLERKPLFGKRVVVTRPQKDAPALAEGIMELGGEPFLYSLIEIQAPHDYAPLDRAIEQIHNFDWLVFTSVNGVKYFFTRLQRLEKDIRDLKGIRLCAIGPATAAALREKGLKVDYVPSEYRAEKLVDTIRSALEPRHKVLVPSSDKARPTLAQMLTSLGAEVTAVTAYRTTPSLKEHASLVKMLEEKSAHAITFTSSSTVQNFVYQLKKELGEEKEFTELLEGVVMASIGPVTSKTAEDLGINIDIEADEYTVEGLVAALEKYFKTY